MLAEVVCILYDEMRAITPAPRSTHVDYTKDLWFFSLCADTLEFLFLQFLTGTERDQLLQDGLSGGRSPNVPVILFRSDEERQAFNSLGISIASCNSQIMTAKTCDRVSKRLGGTFVCGSIPSSCAIIRGGPNKRHQSSIGWPHRGQERGFLSPAAWRLCSHVWGLERRFFLWAKS